MESQIPNLPFELIELIVDFLVYDNVDDGVQKHIFRSMEIKMFDRQYDSDIEDKNSDDEEVLVDEAEMFLSIGGQPEAHVYCDHLLFHTPEYAKYVHSLKIRWRFSNFWNYPPPDLSHLSRLIEHFTSLQSLAILARRQDKMYWESRSSVLQKFLLNLMHLPTITEIKLVSINNFHVSDLIPCVHLRKLTMHDTDPRVEDDIPSLSTNPIPLQELDVGSFNRTMPIIMIREVRRLDGRPVMDLTRLQKLTAEIRWFENSLLIRNLLESTHALVSLEIRIFFDSDTGFRDINFAHMITPSLRTLSELHLTMVHDYMQEDPLCGLCEELKEIVGKNKLTRLNFVVDLFGEAEWKASDEWGRLEEVLLEPGGWPMLEYVSVNVLIFSGTERSPDLEMALERLAELQFAGLAGNGSIEFQFSVIRDDRMH